MSWDDVKAKWSEKSAAAKARWHELTDDDLAEVEGDREALKAKLMEKKAAADGKLDEWKRSLEATGSEVSAGWEDYKATLARWAEEEVAIWQKDL
jgi:uncharacterized protein YjbJ (UPF0337 family)